jgi:anti-sigma factor RsiW
VSRDVDLDRLADYVSGALDGTPEAASVAQLVATDPQWTSAHTALVAADAFVRADLAVLAGAPEPMPDDVVARLNAAFAAEPPLPGPVAADSPPHLSVLPGGRATPTRAPRRWRAVVGVAAALVVLGLGAVSLTPKITSGGAGSASRDTGNSTTDATRTAPAASPGADAPSTYMAGGVNASGADYTPDTLATIGGPSISARSGNSTSSDRPNALEVPSQPTVPLTQVPDPLRRLTEPDARAACLKAVMARYGGTATLLDYARYQGSPALIVLLDGAQGVAGRKWVVAVGPNCGTGVAITDQRYSAAVG